MTNTDWRQSISFSDRFASITRIQVAYRFAQGHGTVDDTQARASALEEQAYRLSESKERYLEAVQARVRDAEAIVPLPCTQLQRAIDLDETSRVISGGVTMGNYVNAVHHRDGIAAAIYKARYVKQVAGNDMVALKVTHPSTLIPPHDSRKEARLLRAAASSNVISLLEAFDHDGGDFILVFPFCRFDLDNILRAGPLPSNAAKAVLRDLFRALSCIHGRGIIHRDIKPSNILMKTPNGPALLADFGIAWSREDPASEPKDNKILDVGTESYRPPELMFGNSKYKSSLDMWAAGCVAAQVIGRGSRTLFDSGDLGSDLALVRSIFETLGTPDLTTWPEAEQFPDWGKMLFHEYPPKSWESILPNVNEKARQLVSGLVRYESKERMTAAMALENAYFTA